MRLSIILPVFDDTQQLRLRLPEVLEIADEVIISQGGNDPEVNALARRWGAQLVQGPPQRGGQLNRGARQATGDALLFLHADTQLPPGAGEAVRGALKGGAMGGGFTLRFGTDHPMMGVIARTINLRTRITRCPLGDQAQFVRRETFEALGGYREWPLLEDLDFARRLKRRGPTALLSPPVITSPRRYLGQGILRTLLVNRLIFTLYAAGVSPHRLARLYHHGR
jgi:rSAM/selenodomain-associated transferase 2